MVLEEQCILYGKKFIRVSSLPNEYRFPRLFIYKSWDYHEYLFKRVQEELGKPVELVPIVLLEDRFLEQAQDGSNEIRVYVFQRLMFYRIKNGGILGVYEGEENGDDRENLFEVFDGQKNLGILKLKGKAFVQIFEEGVIEAYYLPKAIMEGWAVKLYY